MTEEKKSGFFIKGIEFFFSLSLSEEEGEIKMGREEE